MDVGALPDAAQMVAALRVALRRTGDPALRPGLLALLVRLGRHEEALEHGWAVLEADPEDGTSRDLLAQALASLGRVAEVLDLLRGRADEARSCEGLALVAGAAQAWEAAEGLFRRAMALDPRASGALLGLAMALHRQLRLGEALAVLDEAEALVGDDAVLGPRLRFHRASILLLRGDLAAGWEAFESRLELADRRPIAPMPLAPWRGEDLAGRVILLRCEQGFGDGFMFIRFAAALRERGARVLLEAFEGCEEVLATCPGVEAVPRGVVELPGDALQVPLLSLAHRLGTGLSDLPGPIPYLGVPPTARREAVDRALAGTEGPRVGLVWAGNPAHSRDGERSVPAEVMDLLAEVPGVTWVSLQKQDVPRPALPLVELGPMLATFSETAYALSRLDGLICVDTGIAHLAGAMGVPAWVLVTQVPDWRWLLDRDDSPWYPRMRLWRQDRAGDWSDVLAAMAAEMKAGGLPSRSLCR